MNRMLCFAVYLLWVVPGYGLEIRARALPTVTPVPLSPERLAEPVDWKPGMPVREVPRQGLMVDTGGKRGGGTGQELVPGLAKTADGLQVDFDGEGEGFSGVNPPDPVLAAGSRQVVQMINDFNGTRVRVLDRSQPGNGPVLRFVLGSLATGSGTGCVSGWGDPIAHYDRQAARWLLSEFTQDSWCLYVSATDDLLSTVWHLYEFPSRDGGIPDFPKLTQWGDGYYLTTNEGGPYIYAFERDAVLAGQPVTPQVFTAVPPLTGFVFNALQGVNQTGLLPAAGPAPFLRHRDDEAHDSQPVAGQDFIELWWLQPDWTDPGQSVLQGPDDVAVAEFDSDLCGLVTFSCLEQPSSSVRLDPLREVVMWPAVWRQLPDGSQHILGNFVTDADGTDRAAVRWFHLSYTAGNWALQQEGVVDGSDGISRWMGSQAMDDNGGMVLLYNRMDNTSLFPGLALAGRALADPPGSLGVERPLVDGQAANASFRYGDYNTLVADSQDGCLFWGTGLYNPAGNWSTRVFAVRRTGCRDRPLFADSMESPPEVIMSSSFE